MKKQQNNFEFHAHKGNHMKMQHAFCGLLQGSSMAPFLFTVLLIENVYATTLGKRYETQNELINASEKMDKTK